MALRHESQTSISLGVVYFRPLIAELKEFRKKCNLNLGVKIRKLA